MTDNVSHEATGKVAEIIKAEVFVHELPVRRVRRHGSGDVAGGVRNVFLRLEAACGATGWGEAAPWPVFTGTAEANASALEHYLLPGLLGRSAMEAPSLLAEMDKRLVAHPEAKAAIDSALLDLAGQQLDAPAWMLLGGCYNRRLPLSVSLADPEMDADIELIQRLLSEGVRIFKIKTGFLEHREELKRLERLVEAAGPDSSVRVDYNQGLPCFDACRKLMDLDGFGFTFIEQPFAGRYLEQLSELRDKLRTPILADEAVFCLSDLHRTVGLRAADAISIKIMKCGGPRAGAQLAAAAEGAGLATYGGDMFETAIAHAAGAHMICATKGFDLGCEFYHSTYHLECDLQSKPFWVRDGYVQVPDRPGLGIDVDEARMRSEALSSCAVDKNR